MQCNWKIVGGQYEGSKSTYTSTNQIYNEAHTMYDRKMEDFYEEIPQKEVLQQCIRLQKGLTTLFLRSIVAAYYTLYLE